MHGSSSSMQQTYGFGGSQSRSTSMHGSGGSVHQTYGMGGTQGGSTSMHGSAGSMHQAYSGQQSAMASQSGYNQPPGLPQLHATMSRPADNPNLSFFSDTQLNPGVIKAPVRSGNTPQQQQVAPEPRAPAADPGRMTYSRDMGMSSLGQAQQQMSSIGQPQKQMSSIGQPQKQMASVGQLQQQEARGSQR